MTSTLRTSRLVLRPVSPADAAALHGGMTWNVVQWLSGPPWPLAIDDIARHLEKGESDMRDGAAFHYAIVVEDLPYGAVSLAPKNGAMNLGFWLAEPQWGRGFMTEAVGAALDTFFAADPALHVTAGAFVGNAASLAVQKKLGFAVVAENVLWSRPYGKLLPHFETMVGRRSRERHLAA